jgi:hypothetical protein
MMDNNINSNAVANVNLDYSKLEGMAIKHNDTTSRIPILKINTDANSKYPVGCWVVGQKKDNKGNIIDHGVKTSRIVILKVRNKYTYRDEKNFSNNCYSPLHKNFEKVQGSKYHNICGKTCPYRNPDLDKRCKANKVILAIAIDDNNEKNRIDCMAYVKGDSFMPFVDFEKESTIVKIGDQIHNIPFFAFLTSLSSNLVTKPGFKPYYVSVFKRSTFLPQPSIDNLEIKATELDKIVDQINSFIEVMSDDDNEDNSQSQIIVNQEPMKTKTEEKIEYFQNQQQDNPVEITNIDESQIF